MSSIRSQAHDGMTLRMPDKKLKNKYWNY